MPHSVAPRVAWLPAIAAAGPLIVPFAACVWVLVGWAAGTNPFWPMPELNLAEAAAVRDHAEVVRLIEAGHDPNRKWPIAPDVIDSSAHEMTPLEAAISIRRLELVQLLLRHGARVTAGDRANLVERARAAGAPDIVTFLERLET